MFFHRMWIRIYLVLVIAVVLWLEYEKHIELRAWADCRGDCALSLGALTLVQVLVVVGVLSAMLSGWAFNKLRRYVASKKLRAI